MQHNGQEYSLEPVKLSGSRFLYFKANACPVQSPLVLPFGSVVNLSGYQFILEGLQEKPLRLRAIKKSSGKEVQILPSYSCVETINLSGLSQILELEFWVVEKDVDRIQALQIILRSHYLSPPKQGLILGCRFKDQETQRQVLQQARQGNLGQPRDEWSVAWEEKPGGMVACAILDTLIHGNPKGRREIAVSLGREDLLNQWKTLKRTHILNELQIAWVSRIAVDAPYRGIGIGTLLAKHLANLAYYHRVPQATATEVITTVPAEHAKSLLEAKENDFLIQAGYSLCKEIRYSRPLLDVNSTTGDRTIFKKARKLYYYDIAECSEET